MCVPHLCVVLHVPAGILGSALAEDQTIKDMMPDWMTGSAIALSGTAVLSLRNQTFVP